MRWAKAQAATPAGYDLAASGLTPPGPDLLPPEAMGAPWLRGGGDMPREARRRVASHWRADEGEVMLTLGTSQALYLAAAITLRPGDRCFVERPAYEHLGALPDLFGASAVAFERAFTAGFALPDDLARRIAEERPRMVVLTNPHNPSGVLLERSTLAPVAEACAAVGAILFVDEVYLPFVDEPHRHSAFGLPATLIAASLTKAFGLGALRFGWLAGPAKLVEAAIRYNDFVSVVYPSPSAAVALAAFDRLDALRARAVAASEAGRARVSAFIAGRDDVSWHPPDTGIVCFPQIAGLDDTRELCARLRRDHDTLLVPGHFFGAPAHLRLAFGAPTAILDEGLRRLASALDAR